MRVYRRGMDSKQAREIVERLGLTEVCRAKAMEGLPTKRRRPRSAMSLPEPEDR